MRRGIIDGMAYQRDPVSVLFDGGARAFLARVYARPGQWVTTRVADPEPRHAAQLAALGISPAARDTVPGGMARTRWGRGFIRAVYYQHRWWSDGHGGWRRTRRTAARQAGALEVEVTGRRAAAGLLPGGLTVRARLLRGGQAAEAAARRLPDRERIYADHGEGGRHADPGWRDWE